jgi:hypothetical protein
MANKNGLGLPKPTLEKPPFYSVGPAKAADMTGKRAALLESPF